MLCYFFMSLYPFLSFDIYGLYYASRINLYWKSQLLGNSGRRMWVNLSVKEIPNHSWRKLYFKYQTGASVWLIYKCRSSIREKASSHGSSHYIVTPNTSGQAFLALYTSGRSVFSSLFHIRNQVHLLACERYLSCLTSDEPFLLNMRSICSHAQSS